MFSNVFAIFQGSDVNKGVRVGDYHVSIGNAPCKVYELSATELHCKPPAEEPGGTKINGGPIVMVSISVFPPFSVWDINWTSAD